MSYAIVFFGRFPLFSWMDYREDEIKEGEEKKTPMKERMGNHCSHVCTNRH